MPIPVKKKNTEYFKLEPMKPTTELISPDTVSGALQSSLELIMRSYDFEKSYLDKAAEWYAKIAWWYEAAAILWLLSASGTLIGLTICVALAPVFAAFVFGVYYFLTFLLMEHYNITTARNERLREHFRLREQSISDVVAQLERADQQLDGIILALCELNMKSSDKLQALDEYIALLQSRTNNTQAINLDSLSKESDNAIFAAASAIDAFDNYKTSNALFNK